MLLYAIFVWACFFHLNLLIYQQKSSCVVRNPVVVGQAGYRDREESRRAVPVALPPLAGVGDVGADGGGGDGHRSGRVSRGGPGVSPAVRHAAVDRRTGDGRDHLRDPGSAAVRLQAPGGGHHGDGRRDRRMLPGGAGHCRAELGAGRPARGRAALRRARERRAGHGHPGGHGHAARHLPSLGPDARAHRHPRPGAEEAPVPLRGHRRRAGHEHRGGDQRRHAHHGRPNVPQPWPGQRRRDQPGLPDPGAAAGAGLQRAFRA